MPMLTIMPSGKTLQAETGARLLDAILTSGADIAHKCDAKAECGSCHVFVHDGRKSLSKIQRTENDKLDTLVGVSSKSRLACQAIIGAENITVELLDFI